MVTEYDLAGLHKQVKVIGLKRAPDDKDAFLRALKEELDAIRADLRKDLKEGDTHG